jgi:multiple antibiotic resistance protein
MLKTAVVAFSTFFATVSPVDVAAIYAGLTASAPPGRRRAMAVKGTLIAGGVLVVFVLAGKPLLEFMGITLPALRAAGGVLLLLIAIDMVFARPSGGTSTTDDETREARLKDDISVFPLATPLIAGPGAMGAAIVLASGTGGGALHLVVVLGALIAVLAITLALLLAAVQVQRLLGVTAVNVIGRVVGVLLAALAVQFIFDGIKDSGLFP